MENDWNRCGSLEVNGKIVDGRFIAHEKLFVSLKSRRLSVDTQFACTRPSKHNHFIPNEV